MKEKGETVMDARWLSQYEGETGHDELLSSRWRGVRIWVQTQVEVVKE